MAAIPPIYFVLPEYAIEKYWMDMVDATDLDFVIYNIPQTTGYALSMNLFDKMRQNKKVIGVKNSSLCRISLTLNPRLEMTLSSLTARMNSLWAAA